ncbi:hypothetical protein Nepgr_014791 [Nepenthes gracilis]|uniref:PI3K/PI4K catalytic domain-containing protein n=1 Tax=Nepenthes gracilis TaxID=150966 RepID=A0AAD3SJW9_NEPGR|nr:hypothetical protein Nepgr_014791 [Nepenthes gracilis]
MSKIVRRSSTPYPKTKKCHSFIPSSPDCDSSPNSSQLCSLQMNSSVNMDSEAMDSMDSLRPECEFLSLNATRKVSFKVQSGDRDSRVAAGIYVSPPTPVFHIDLCKEEAGLSQPMQFEIVLTRKSKFINFFRVVWVGYIVRLGDRHSMNILIDQATAEVVHIDLIVAFEQGLMLKTPERAPFRLTRDIVDGMGVTGIECVFRRCREETLTVMQTNKEALLTIVEVFIYDPLYKWASSPLKTLERKKQPGADYNSINSAIFSSWFGKLLKPDPAAAISSAAFCLAAVQKLMGDCHYLIFSACCRKGCLASDQLMKVIAPSLFEIAVWLKWACAMVSLWSCKLYRDEAGVWICCLLVLAGSLFAVISGSCAYILTGYRPDDEVFAVDIGYDLDPGSVFGDLDAWKLVGLAVGSCSSHCCVDVDFFVAAVPSLTSSRCPWKAMQPGHTSSFSNKFPVWDAY